MGSWFGIGVVMALPIYPGVRKCIQGETCHCRSRYSGLTTKSPYAGYIYTYIYIYMYIYIYIYIYVCPSHCVMHLAALVHRVAPLERRTVYARMTLAREDSAEVPPHDTQTVLLCARRGSDLDWRPGIEDLQRMVLLRGHLIFEIE